MLTEKQIIDAIPVRQEGWTEEQMFIWFGRFLERELTKQLKDFISSDSTAISFQSLGQYRTALLNILEDK